MSKVTQKNQVSIPKKLANQYGIHPGDEVSWTCTTSGLLLTAAEDSKLTLDERLALFQASVNRIFERQEKQPVESASERGWTRDDLYS